MANNEQNLEQRIVESMAKLRGGRGTRKELAQGLAPRQAERAAIDAALERLVERGEIVETRRGDYVLLAASASFATGRLQMHREGFGFITPNHPIQGIDGDLYISREEAGKAMHGDRVLVRVNAARRGGRASGDIVRVLNRAQTTVVGEFRTRPKGNFVVPHDPRIRHWIEIPEGMETPRDTLDRDRVGAPAVEVKSVDDLNGMIVNVEVTEFPEDGERPVGRVIEVLGQPDAFGVDVEVMIRKHHIPHRFPQDVLDQAAAVTAETGEAALAGRRDFRSMEIVTIDGETARDFDDAVWVDGLPGGNFALHVHIAAVSHYVLPGSPIDVAARQRGASVYCPARAVPMLPVELSTDICSLKPQVDRLVLSALLEIDHRGEVVKQEFTRGVIRSAERMTYTAVHGLLEGDAALRERYAPLIPRFEKMRDLALILNKKRVRRGSIDFDLPEPLIEFDEFGEMTGVTRLARNIAHRIIEEFMLAANEAVAGHLEGLGLPSIYRIHDPPDAKRVMEFEDVAAQFGYSLGIGAIPVRRHAVVERRRDGGKSRRDVVMAAENTAVSSRNYQRLVAKIEGKPEERILSYLMLRSLKQARYSEVNKGHFALAAPSYTHFTSPIRRYPDLMIHRLLKAWLDGRASGYSEDELRAIAAGASETERQAAEAERELVEWKKARFMEDRVGEEYSALIISTTKFGFFVELESMFIEGLVPMETLPGDRFVYHENTRTIIGIRTRRQFSIGGRVTVRLDRVDTMERKLQFAVVEEQPPRKKKKKK